MVLKIEPIHKAIKEIKKKGAKIIFLSPRGKKFTQKLAKKWVKEKQLIFVSGRYEGIDERIKKLASETVSVGDFITLGGEVPAMAIIEAIARLVPGVVGKRTSIEKPDFPQYTRPEIFSPRLRQGFGGQAKKGVKWVVPKVLVSGNHKKIDQWRKKKSKEIK